MINFLKNRVLIFLLVLFVVIIVLLIIFWMNKILESIRLVELNVIVVYIGIIVFNGMWQFKVEDRVLIDCVVVYVYNYIFFGKFVVYELDFKVFKVINFFEEIFLFECKGELIYGYFIVNFMKFFEMLIIDVWVGIILINDGYIYFCQIGDWMFINGLYVGYKVFFLSNNYMLMFIKELGKIMNLIGIYVVNCC